MLTIYKSLSGSLNALIKVWLKFSCLISRIAIYDLVGVLSNEERTKTNAVLVQNCEPKNKQRYLRKGSRPIAVLVQRLVNTKKNPHGRGACV